MAVELTMPKMGHVEEEATVSQWMKREGDRVAKGEILLAVETDKAVLDVESFTSGVVLKILVEEGETVPIGTPLAILGEEGEEV